MEFNRASVVDRNFREFLESWVPGGSSPPGLDTSTGLEAADLVEILESMMVSRHLDIEAREMRARGEGFYTIGSSGHEGNAMVGRAARHTDIAFLHYRSGAFVAERARKVEGVDVVVDTALGLAASAEDPIAGGRHKVWGSAPLWIPPQTSTIGSHLPKAVGAAFALERARTLGRELRIPVDSIVVCSFGDASVNHASAQTALNAASWAAHQRVPLPVLFVCEDNGIGVSVHTPTGWVRSSLESRPHVRYFAADGLDPRKGWRTVVDALRHVRDERRPAVLHLEMVRLLGHAGSDPEWEYHSEEQIESAEARDPLLATARAVLESGLMLAPEVLDRYESIRTRVRAAAREAAKTPKLTSREEIEAPLFVEDAVAVREAAGGVPPEGERARVFGGEHRLPEKGPARHMAMLLNYALHDLLIQYPEAMVFGEDVGRKGGVYHVTADLSQRFGVGRVFNTLLDETMILGMAIGAAHLGFLPVPEIQYLAYLHNAEDQLRGEACSLQFFSADQFRNPMVVRIAAWAYQRGFGGHFHNDNGISVLRDIPGLVIASPSRGDDAVGMLRTCMALASRTGRVCVFLEPIALYMKRDLYDDKDGLWSFPYPSPGESVSLGEGRVYEESRADLTILTWSNGVHLSLRAARTLEREHDARAEVVDLRWLKPLNDEFLLARASETGRVLIVDEGRRTGGVGEEILAVLAERGERDWTCARVTGADCYLPLGPAADRMLPSEGEIVDAARKLVEAGSGK